MFAHYLAGVIDGDGWFGTRGYVGVAFHEHDRAIAVYIRD
jgi:hypothetical protein